MSAYRGNDPVELIIADALDFRHIEYDAPCPITGLDFHLVQSGLKIECKRFHSDRINKQMQRAGNIILIQGIDAARAMSSFIKGTGL